MIPDASVDLAIVDPPYGINFRSNYRKSSTLKTTTEGIANGGVNNADMTAWLFEQLRKMARFQHQNLTQIDASIRVSTDRLSDLQRAREKETASLAQTEQMIKELEGEIYD